MEVGREGVQLFESGIEGEGIIYQGFGVGSDIGYVFPKGRDFGNGFGLLTAYGVYQFGNRSREARWTPFVLAGYSMGFRDSTINGVNVGGGVTRWMTERLGVRFEGRHHSFMPDTGFNMTMFRFGLSFR
jgi:hypothetical protein